MSKRPMSVQEQTDRYLGEVRDHAPFRSDDKRQMIANGVPRWLGRAMARAVRRAVYAEAVAS